MKRLASIATLLIAVMAPSMGANGQEVYRCGNAYSEKPCAQGVRIDVEDSRTAEQKSASDARIQRELATAHAMETARLQEDARQRAQAQKQSTARTKKTGSKPRAAGADKANPDAAHAGTSKRQSKKKRKAPEFFTARAGAERPRAAASAAK